jgi:glyoxylate/hydroxypyruvate reductase
MAMLMMSKYAGRYVDPETWRRELLEAIPDLDFRLWPEVGDPEAIEMVLADFAPPGFLRSLPNLKLVSYLGYGVDNLFKDPELPAKVPITRISGAGIADQVAQYVLLYLLRRHRLLDHYDNLQRRRRWDPTRPKRNNEVVVGVLGLGTLGTKVASILAEIGLPVIGWSRTLKRIDGIECLAGEEALADVLGRSDYIVCVLPLTPATHHILKRETFALCKRGAYLINVGRGGHVADFDLIEAVDSGLLSGATLDVCELEPLPEGHPIWGHPRITVTPHVAAFFVDDGIAEAAENYRRLKRGEQIPHTVDRAVGY